MSSFRTVRLKNPKKEFSIQFLDQTVRRALAILYLYSLRRNTSHNVFHLPYHRTLDKYVLMNGSFDSLRIVKILFVQNETISFIVILTNSFHGLWDRCFIEISWLIFYCWIWWKLVIHSHHFFMLKLKL